MNIKQEYVERTREYLNKLYDSLSLIDLKKLEIEELKKVEKYQEIDFTKIVGFGNKTEYKDISDLKIYIEDQIYIKECEIEHINNKYNKLTSYIATFKHVEKDIINYRYFLRKECNSKYTIDDIALKTKYSIASVKRIERKAIEKIAVYIYKKDAIESEPKVS